MTTENHIRHEVEVDTRIAAAFEEQLKAEQRFIVAVARLHDAVGDRESLRPGRRIRTWGMTPSEVIDAAERIIAGEDKAAARRVTEAHMGYRTRREAMDAARTFYEATAAEYEGWSRFFLVRASNGHIHSSMSCSTCFPTTEYGWLVDVSGLTEAEAVAVHGERLCTVCYPSAPSAWTDADAYYARLAREGRGVREADRAAKQDAKAAKAAERRLTYHYGERYTRASDGAVFNYYEDYRHELDWGRATTLKAIVRKRKDEGDYNGHTDIIDLDTMEVVTMEQAEALLKEQRTAAKGAK